MSWQWHERQSQAAENHMPYLMLLVFNDQFRLFRLVKLVTEWVYLGLGWYWQALIRQPLMLPHLNIPYNLNRWMTLCLILLVQTTLILCKHSCLYALPVKCDAGKWMEDGIFCRALSSWSTTAWFFTGWFICDCDNGSYSVHWITLRWVSGVGKRRDATLTWANITCTWTQMQSSLNSLMWKQVQPTFVKY